MANKKKAPATKKAKAGVARPSKKRKPPSRRKRVSEVVAKTAQSRRSRATADDTASPAMHRAKPFVKWAGGKRQLLREIEQHIPPGFGTYHEPFLGGGAVFFSLPLGTPARLSDFNKRLVRTYKGIRDDVEGVIAILNKYPRNRHFFEEMRKRVIDDATDTEIAAWFIYLNKTGFNGLYRVNSKNQFNVPYGSHKKDARYFDEANLRACAASLKSADIEHQDFEEALKHVEKGDFVYLDPPYVPLSITSNFTSYTAGRFTPGDQERLRNAALELKRKGVHVVLSNSSSAAHLYKDGFDTIEVLASRQVNSKGTGRGKIKELLIK